SVKFTRELERKLEAIQKGQINKQQVIDEASLQLTKILQLFKENEETIALSLSETLQASNSLKWIIGLCPICKKGDLQIIRSKRTGKRFAGCTNYRDGNCTATFPLPQPPFKIWTTNMPCQVCRWPKVTVKSPGKRRLWSLCLNPSCPTKISMKQP
ncbi:DNA topoisomerase I, partial [Candidatus Bathyarchaeota archaeon]|nr:DNA topoisomerase I [Candidatus Bathyarchaeota archaeon]